MTEPRWLRVAQDELRAGVSEIPGSIHNKRILEYHAATSWAFGADEVPWCSSFLCWVMREAGVSSTLSARARSWLAWGVPIAHPPIGAVVILSRGRGPQPGAEVFDAPGHVGLLVGEASSDEILLLGGNQSDRVCVKSYSRESVLGYRWPI